MPSVSIKVPDFDAPLRSAVAHYWKSLADQEAHQGRGKGRDRGRRTAVTGGRQMDGFCDLVNWILIENGLPSACIHRRRGSVLPGYFRASKNWDLLVVHERVLVAALEFKSQRGPSFGNNLNNRTEEALGNAVDLWTAWREGAFGRQQPKPWLGWLMLLEDCPGSRRVVRVDEPHFEAFPEFRGTAYSMRYELLLRKLVLEKHYDRAALLLATEEQGRLGEHSEPARDLSMKSFLLGLAGHVATYVAGL